MAPDGSRALDHHGGKHEHTGRHGAGIVKTLQLTHKWEGGREWTSRKCHVLLKTQNQSSVTHFFLPKHSNIWAYRGHLHSNHHREAKFLCLYLFIYYFTLNISWVARTRNSEKLSVFLKNDGKHHLPSLNTAVILQRCAEPALLLILSADDWLNPRRLQMTGWTPDGSKSSGLSHCLEAPTVHTPSQQEPEAQYNICSWCWCLKTVDTILLITDCLYFNVMFIL